MNYLRAAHNSWRGGTITRASAREARSNMTQTEFIADVLARPRDERRILIFGHFLETCKPDRQNPGRPFEEAYMHDSWYLRLPQDVKDDLNEDFGAAGSHPEPPDDLCASLRARSRL